MQQLLLKQLEQWARSILLSAWRLREGMVEHLGTGIILFGIAKKLIGTSTSQWARQMEFFTLPGEEYRGWNLFCPVAFEANVLSLPEQKTCGRRPTAC